VVRNIYVQGSLAAWVWLPNDSRTFFFISKLEDSIFAEHSGHPVLLGHGNLTEYAADNCVAYWLPEAESVGRCRA
jgi:hypothetical protein